MGGWVDGWVGGYLQEVMPLHGSILQAGTCQILSLAENPIWSRVWQNVYRHNWSLLHPPLVEIATIISTPKLGCQRTQMIFLTSLALQQETNLVLSQPKRQPNTTSTLYLGWT